MNARKRDTIKVSAKPIEVVEEVQSETVSVMLMKSLIVKARGEVTGKQYIFNGAGSIVNIDKEDLEGLLKSNRARQSCCGSYSSPYFNVV